MATIQKPFEDIIKYYKTEIPDEVKFQIYEYQSKKDAEKVAVLFERYFKGADDGVSCATVDGKNCNVIVLLKPGAEALKVERAQNALNEIRRTEYQIEIIIDQVK